MNKKISNWLFLTSLGLGFMQEYYSKIEKSTKILGNYTNPTKKTPDRKEIRKRRKQQRLARKMARRKKR